MSYENPWLYDGKVFESEDIKDYFGFCYILTDFENGKQYIGRKYFYSVRKKKGIRKKVRSESDWKSYYSSSKKIQQMVQESGSNRFKREILSLYKKKGQVNYNETKLLFQHNVLEAVNDDGEKLYYNENIMNRYFSTIME
ncbi:MAG: NAD synthetase [SAR324 cluster bacterium]|nr:NAD synthetase [SAR324 cluster bacterium]